MHVLDAPAQLGAAVFSLLHSGRLLGLASVWSLSLARASSSDRALKYLPEGDTFPLPTTWGSLSYYRPPWLFLEARGFDRLTAFKKQFFFLYICLQNYPGLSHSSWKAQNSSKTESTFYVASWADGWILELEQQVHQLTPDRLLLRI